MWLMSNLFIVYDMLTVFSHVSVRLVEAVVDISTGLNWKNAKVMCNLICGLKK